MKTLLWIVVVAIIGIALIGMVSGRRGEPAVDRADLHLTAEQARSMTALLQGSGYNCPAVNLARAKGQDAYGIVFKVWCGPPGTTDVYQNLVFRVTARPNGEWTAAPWD